MSFLHASMLSRLGIATGCVLATRGAPAAAVAASAFAFAASVGPAPVHAAPAAVGGAPDLAWAGRCPADPAGRPAQACIPRHAHGACAGHACVRVRLLHAFGAEPDDGRRPADGLALGPDGALYGAASGGGEHGFGRLFRLCVDGKETVLHDFRGRPGDGADPQAPPTPDGAGGLVGTTHLGGAHGLGSVYRLDASGAMRLLHSFAGGPHDGAHPQAPLLRARDGSFYGTTRDGGAHGAGLLFRLDPRGAYEALRSLGGGADALADPIGALAELDDGRIVAAASAGGRHGLGGVFDYRPGSRKLHTLVSLGAGSDCAMPMAGLVRARDGRLIATAYAGGPDNAGCVFSVSDSGQYQVLYALRGADDGAQPLSVPLEADDGSLYLSSSLGAAHGDGALLRLDVNGCPLVLHAFGRADVSVPSGALLRAADTRIYGTAPYGGTYDEGVIFVVLRPEPDAAGLAHAGGSLNAPESTPARPRAACSPRSPRRSAP